MRNVAPFLIGMTLAEMTRQGILSEVAGLVALFAMMAVYGLVMYGVQRRKR